MKEKQGVLKQADGRIEAKIAAGFDPKEFYRDRKGLWVSSGFESRILPEAQVSKEAVDASLSSFDLTEDSTDEQIEEALGEGHLFDRSALCAIMADLISKQPEGEEGILLSSGYANLFYTGAFVVFVRWGDSEWRVGAYPRGGYEWDGDRRVFSPATDRS